MGLGMGANWGSATGTRARSAVPVRGRTRARAASASGELGASQAGGTAHKAANTARSEARSNEGAPWSSPKGPGRRKRRDGGPARKSQGSPSTRRPWTAAPLRSSSRWVR